MSSTNMSQKDIAQAIADEVIYILQLAFVLTAKGSGKQLGQALVSCQRVKGTLGSWILGLQLRTSGYRVVTTRISFGRGANSSERQWDTSHQVHPCHPVLLQTLIESVSHAAHHGQNSLCQPNARKTSGLDMEFHPDTQWWLLSWDCDCRMCQSLSGKLYASWTMNMHPSCSLWAWSVGFHLEGARSHPWQNYPEPPGFWMGLPTPTSWYFWLHWSWGVSLRRTVWAASLVLPTLSPEHHYDSGLCSQSTSFAMALGQHGMGLGHMSKSDGCHCPQMISPPRPFLEPSPSGGQLSGELSPVWVTSPWWLAHNICTGVIALMGPMKYGVSYARADEDLTVKLCTFCWVVSCSSLTWCLFSISCHLASISILHLSMPTIAPTCGTWHGFW